MSKTIIPTQCSKPLSTHTTALEFFEFFQPVCTSSSFFLLLRNWVCPKNSPSIWWKILKCTECAPVANQLKIVMVNIWIWFPVSLWMLKIQWASFLILTQNLKKLLSFYGHLGHHQQTSHPQLIYKRTSIIWFCEPPWEAVCKLLTIFLFLETSIWRAPFEHADSCKGLMSHHHSCIAASSWIAAEMHNCWRSFPWWSPGYVVGLFSLSRCACAASALLAAFDESFNQQLWQPNFSVFSRRSASVLLTALACNKNTRGFIAIIRCGPLASM